MAGHRQARGAPRRDEARTQRMRQRLAAAQTAEEQLAVAFDWFRASAARIKDAPERARCMRKASEFLISLITEIGRDA
jgi:hypothetical protein